MSLNESIVEEAALTWFRRRQGYAGQVGELGYAVGHGPQLAPGEPAAERDSYGEVELVGRMRENIRRLTPPIRSGFFATVRYTLLPNFLSKDLRAAAGECQEAVL